MQQELRWNCCFMIDCIVIENHRTQSLVIGSSSHFLLSHRAFLSWFPVSDNLQSPGMFRYQLAVWIIEQLWFQIVIGGVPSWGGLRPCSPFPSLPMLDASLPKLKHIVSFLSSFSSSSTSPPRLPSFALEQRPLRRWRWEWWSRWDLWWCWRWKP